MNRKKKSTAKRTSRKAPKRGKNARSHQKGSQPLRPRARLIRAIGEELISNTATALIELIKNSYDADASYVKIRFIPPLEPGEGAIEITDDGHGITPETLRTSWMEPSTDHKVVSKTSPKGRRVTGEKGLGRFSAARLAHELHIDSVSGPPYNRVQAHFNWDDYEQTDKYVDEIATPWEVEPLRRRTNTGTTLNLRRLKDSWSDLDKELLPKLRRLVAQKEKEGSDSEDFSIVVAGGPGKSSDHEERISLPKVLSHPHYEMKASVDADGVADIRLKSGRRRRSETKQLLLEGGRDLSCGPFDFELKAWDRDRRGLDPLVSKLGQGIRDLRYDLDQIAGVSIYRDGFRVLPYGDPEHDWLSINQRRVNNPTLRFSANQVVGTAYIRADTNKDLKDKTNREGMIENHAYSDFREALLLLMSELEALRHDVRRPEQDRDEYRKQQSLFRDIQIDDITDEFRQKYPNDTSFQQRLDRKKDAVSRGVARVQQVLSRYRRLATMGKLVDTIVHDGSTPLGGIKTQVKSAQKTLSGNQPNLDTVRERLSKILEQADVLAALFSRIEPFVSRAQGRPKIIVLEEALLSLIELQKTSITRLGVEVRMPRTRTRVTLDPSDIHQIFSNLIDNSLYWLSRTKSGDKAIDISVERSEDQVSVLFSDSGPGVDPSSADLIFDPYYSTKPNGTGLGLNIAGEVAADLGGSLELLEAGPLSGATFRVTFKKRIGRTS